MRSPCQEAQPGCPSLSVIIPTLNEEDGLASTIESVGQDGDVEIIVSDGGSNDDTVKVAEACGATVVRGARGRGPQLITGVNAASPHARDLLFLHADTRLPADYRNQIATLLAERDVIAGAFCLAFVHPSPSLRLIAWGANLRSRWRDLPYGDQALFMRRDDYIRLGGFRPLAVMEDYEFVHRLRRAGRIRVSKLAVMTSARKYRSYGPWRTVLRHQIMIWFWKS